MTSLAHLFSPILKFILFRLTFDLKNDLKENTFKYERNGCAKDAIHILLKNSNDLNKI